MHIYKNLKHYFNLEFDNSPSYYQIYTTFKSYINDYAFIKNDIKNLFTLSMPKF